MTKKKLCPFSGRDCVEEECALWIHAEKGAISPFYKYVYDGCGMVHTILWKVVKTEEAESLGEEPESD